MARRLFVFDEPDRFVAGAVGSPGDRAFYLQARQGRAVVTLGLEKAQVAALAAQIGHLLAASARRARSNAEPPGTLEVPMVELFRVGMIALGWDAASESLIVEARPISDDGEYPEVDDADDEGPDVVRVRLSPEEAHRFAVAAAAVVAAGRPTCPFCGQPIDAGGHFCPRSNGTLN